MSAATSAGSRRPAPAPRSRSSLAATLPLALALALGALAVSLLGWVPVARAQLEALQVHTGETLDGGWRVERVERHAEFVRLHFVRGDEQAHLEINARAQLETPLASERFVIQPAPEGFAPPELQAAVLAALRAAEAGPVSTGTPSGFITLGADQPAPARPARPALQVARVQRFIQILLALACALLLVGLARELWARRRRGEPLLHGARAWLRLHGVPLAVLTLSGALLRVAGGVRVPGFEGDHGHGHGFDELNALLEDRLPRIDPHGNGQAALAELLFALVPRTEASWIAFQATLSVLTIPLVYASALGWLSSQRAATWSTAVYALSPTVAYFAMTELRLLPGAFFIMAAVATSALGLAQGRATWLLAGGLFAVLAATLHPVLAPAPLVLALLYVGRPGGLRALRSGPALAALGITAATWALVLRAIVLQVTAEGATGSLGPDALGHLRLWPRVLLPTLGLPTHPPFNAFLNTTTTPPLVGLMWFVALTQLRDPSRRRALGTLVLAALGMTLPGMLGGRYNLARLQFGALPLHAIVAGVGLVASLEFAQRWALPPRVRRALPAALALLLGLSAAAAPGPLGGELAYAAERRVVLAALPQLRAGCDVWVAPSLEQAYAGAPTYLTSDVIPAWRWRRLEPGDDVRARVAASLAESTCAYYYRPSVCWTQRRGEAPARPDPSALRAECAATEAALVLEPLHVSRVPARAGAAASYRRPEIDVGFFHIRGVAL